jgi:hypothetical protein
MPESLRWKALRTGVKQSGVPPGFKFSALPGFPGFCVAMKTDLQENLSILLEKNIESNEKIGAIYRGRCLDHIFLRFSAKFFFSKTNVKIKFLKKTIRCFSKKRQFFN